MNESISKIMNKENKDWNKFYNLLEGKEGCNFKEKVKGEPESITWKCSGDRNKPLATKILKKHFPKIDIKETLMYFEKHGGYCDCEILFNVG